MVLSKSARRFVSGTIAVLFMACQGAAVAYARAVDSQQPDATQGSCHEPAQQSDKTPLRSDCPASCLSQLASTQPGSAVFTAIDAAVPIRIDRTIAVADQAPPTEPPLLRVEPPPLAILHCCLRN